MAFFMTGALTLDHRLRGHGNTVRSGRAVNIPKNIKD
jgi:hypothetical protein